MSCLKQEDPVCFVLLMEVWLLVVVVAVHRLFLHRQLIFHKTKCKPLPCCNVSNNRHHLSHSVVIRLHLILPLAVVSAHHPLHLEILPSAVVLVLLLLLLDLQAIHQPVEVLLRILQQALDLESTLSQVDRILFHLLQLLHLRRHSSILLRAVDSVELLHRVDHISSILLQAVDLVHP